MKRYSITIQLFQLRCQAIALRALSLLGILGAVVVLWTPSPAEAFNPQPDPPLFGMVGVTRNQTVRLNIVNIADPSDDGSVCEIQPTPFLLGFFDSAGNRVVATRVMLRLGEAAFLDFKPAEFMPSLRPRERVQIYPTVEEVRGIEPSPFFCGIVTVEVFGRNGQTTVIYDGYP